MTHICGIGTLILCLISARSIAQVDTSSYSPELIHQMRLPNDHFGRNETLNILSDERCAQFLFYVQNPSTKVNEIWCSNGTKATTRLIGTIRGNDEIRLLGILGGDYVLGIGRNLWLMNLEKKHIHQLILKNKLDQQFNLRSAFIRNNHIYFLDDGLYCSDGTQASTFKIKENTTGDEPQISGAIRYECELKDCWIFIASDIQNNDWIWACDGTMEGTRKLQPLSAHDSLAATSTIIPTYLIGSESRAIFSDENNRLFISDGTHQGTYLLPYHLSDKPNSFYNLPFTIFQDEFYWVDRESSAIWKTDSESRTWHQLCEQDSIPLGGTFAEFEGKGYWISDGLRSDPFGKKIDLTTCKVTADCEDNDCMNEAFYVIQLNNKVCAYYQKPGKMKTPLNVFEQVTKNEKYDNKPNCINGTLNYLAPELFEIESPQYNRTWIVNLKKNSIRSISFDQSNVYDYFSNPLLHVNGNHIYYSVRSVGMVSLYSIEK